MGGLNKLTRDLGDEISAVRSSLTGTADALETLRKGDISSLAKELTSLEQKVAKWVHAHPLPAKVSEARLYALEARLAEETDARLHLEYSFNNKTNAKHANGGTTPRTHGSNNSILPNLVCHKVNTINTIT